MMLGTRVFGAGIMALGVFCLVSGEFVIGLPLPDGFPNPGALALGAGAFMLAAGAALEWRRKAVWAAAALAAFYGVIVFILIDAPYVPSHLAEYGTYSNIAEQVAIVAAGLIVFAAGAGMDATTSGRMVRTGQILFGICALLFGGAHFVYLNLTVPLVPKFLPPSQVFWAYATGVAHIAAGIAVLSGVRAWLAAILLTAMYASFTPLVHLPMLLADPSSHFIWSENALNIALTGAAWVVADSLRPWSAGT
jgi:uncharacterized membrane protein YphA (DoxX/SURF4 family)